MSGLFSILLFLRIAHPTLLHPSLVDRFYQQKQQSLFWFAPGETADALRKQLLVTLDSAAWYGLDSSRYLSEGIRDTLYESLIRGREIHGSREADSLEWIRRDRIFTDAAIAFCKDLYQGAGIYSMVSYDGVSAANENKDNAFILDKLVAAASPAGLISLISGLEPATGAYRTLKDTLRAALGTGDGADTVARNEHRIRQLSSAMNTYRWVRHNRFNRFITVNVASATLRYYEDDSLKITMKIVAGQTSKRTPRFAAYCDKVILYPYWNVPRKIAVNEFLPLFKKTPGMIVLMNIQLVDDKGKIVDPVHLPWEKFTKNNFPYAMRQSTGCDNALGIIKFNLTSPYDVYMHDTNLKSAFRSAYRYYSHGCIRLEKPVELGNALLDNRLDTTFLRSCLKEQQPLPVNLETPVPVFVIYATVEADEQGIIHYYKDVYHLEP